MANRKIKFPLWLMPETKATVERLYRQDGCSSQSEFMERAISVLLRYLQSEYAGDFPAEDPRRNAGGHPQYVR